MNVDSKAIIRIWKDGISWFAMASYMIKSLITGKVDQVINEHVVLGKGIGTLNISSVFLKKFTLLRYSWLVVYVDWCWLLFIKDYTKSWPQKEYPDL